MPSVRPRAAVRSDSRSADSSSAVPLGVGVEGAEGLLEVGPPWPAARPGAAALGVAAVEGRQLGAGHVQAHGPELVGQAGVGAGGGGLALQRADLALDLADQVEQALEVLLGGGQPALGPLAAAAVLEDARPPPR